MDIICDKILHDEDFDFVNGQYNSAPDDPCLHVGDTVRHIDGGPEMLIIKRYFLDALNGERAIARWCNRSEEEQEFDFFCGNLRRVTTTMKS